MHKELLNLKPKRYLCPACGCWHSWEGEDLENYSNFGGEHTICAKLQGLFSLSVTGDYLRVWVEGLCRCDGFDGMIPIDSIIESTKRPIITFPIEVSAGYLLSAYQKCSCPFSKICNIRAIFTDPSYGSSCERIFTLGFEFDEDEYWKIVNPQKLLAKESKNILGIKKQESNYQHKKESAPKQWTRKVFFQE